MKKLKKAYIEITNVCNLSCAFCPGTSRKPEFMSADRFRTVLGKLSGLTDHLYLHVLGEPLLHPEIAGFLRLCGDYGYKVNITTNGLLIGGMTNVLLGSSALRQVNISLHSQEESGDAKGLEDYLEDIFRFAEKAQEKGGINVAFRLWNISSGAAEKYNTLVAERIQKRFDPGFPVAEALQVQDRIKLRERLYLNSARVFQWPSVTACETGEKGFCLGLRDQIAVLVDGTVVPCCLDSGGIIKLGNLFEEELGDILAGERARAIYEGFSVRRAVEELCRKCSYRTRFSEDT